MHLCEPFLFRHQAVVSLLRRKGRNLLFERRARHVEDLERRLEVVLAVSPWCAFTVTVLVALALSCSLAVLLILLIVVFGVTTKMKVGFAVLGGGCGSACTCTGGWAGAACRCGLCFGRCFRRWCGRCASEDGGLGDGAAEEGFAVQDQRLDVLRREVAVLARPEWSRADQP